MDKTPLFEELPVQNIRERAVSELTRRNYHYQWDTWRGLGRESKYERPTSATGNGGALHCRAS